MSILNDPIPVNPTPCMIAHKMKLQARNIYNNLVALFNDGSKDFWQNPHASPTAIADCLGTDGKELFQLHALIGQLIAQVDPQAISDGASVVGNFSYTEDGKVVIQPNTTQSPV